MTSSRPVVPQESGERAFVKPLPVSPDLVIREWEDLLSPQERAEMNAHLEAMAKARAEAEVNARGYIVW